MAATFIDAPWYLPPVTSVLLVPPAEEPLTLAQAKLRAGLDWPDGDPRDDLMQDFIAAARAQVELDTGLALLTQTRGITFHESAAWSAESGYVPLPMQTLPLQSLTDPNGNPATFTTGFERRRAVARLTSSFTPGMWTAVAGWEDAAALRQQAPGLVQAVGLLVAHFATVGRDAVIVGTIATPNPLGYDECINPYRLVTLA